MKFINLLAFVLLSTPSFAAVTGYQINPAQITSGSSKVLQLMELHDDGPSVDVTTQYSFAAASGLTITTFAGKPVAVGGVAGSQALVVTNIATSAKLGGLALSVIPGPAYKLKYISGSAQKGLVGSALSSPLAVQVTDIAGNGVNGIKVDFSILSGSATLSADSSQTDVNGNASVNLNFGLIWGPVSIQAKTDSSVPSVSSYIFSETSSPATNVASALAFIDIPLTNVVYGSSFPAVTLQLMDSNGLPVSASSLLSISAYKNSSCTSAALGTLSGSASATSNSSGLATFTGLSYSQADTIYLRASGTNLTPICSQAISIIQPIGASAKLAITAVPQSGIQNHQLFPQVQVEIHDSNNKLVSTATDSISLDVFTDSACTVHGTGSTGNTASAVAGKAFFPTFSSEQAGSVWIRASSGAMQTACAGPVDISEDPSLVASGLQFNDENALVQTTGLILNNAPGVEVISVFNQAVTAGTYPVSLAAYTDSNCSSSPSTHMQGASAQNTLNGFASFSGIFFDQAGTYYLRASSGSLPIACSTAVIVSDPGMGQVAKIAWSAALPSTILAGQALNPVIAVKDLAGNAVTSVSVPLQIKAYSDSECTIPATEPNYNSGFAQNGSWAVPNYIFKSVEQVYIGVTGSRLAPICSSSISVTPAPAYQIAIVSGNNQDAEVGNQLRNPIVALVTDQFNNPVPNTSIQFSVSNSGYVLPQSTINSDSTGSVQVVVVLGQLPGAQTIQVGSASLAGATKFVTFAANGQVSSDGGGVIQNGTNVQIQASVGVPSSALSGAVNQTASDGSIVVQVGDENSINIQGQN